MGRIYYIIYFINIIYPCYTCGPPPGSPLARGVENGVFLLLGAITFVLISIIATIAYFYYRSNKINYGEN